MITHLRALKSLRILTGVTSVAVLGVAGVLYAMPPTAPAGSPAPPNPETPLPPAVVKPVVSDVELARGILAAFDADPILKDVNLIVSVVDRVAVIGGPVNSSEVMKRAEQLVRGVPGIDSVKNLCFVQADPDPLLRAVAERMKPGAKPTGSAALPGVAIPPSAPDGFLPPLPPIPPSDLAVGNNPNTVVAQKPGLPIGPAVGILGAPIAPPGMGAAPSPVGPIPTPGPAALTGSNTAKPDNLQAAIAAIRATNISFAKLTVEVKPDGALFISGSAVKPADVWAFAAQLAKLPGVARVAVDPNLVK
ncbi:MAG: BON domain-containing protein [Planctomycetia bacterium]|nr:BON domain-containing protein [Planctomycetia bacterium]